jgi:hypothetical protein
MNLDDQQLDSLLRDVEVSRDLTRELLALPDADEAAPELFRPRPVDNSQVRRYARFWGRGLAIGVGLTAVAASLCGILAAIFWSKNADTPQIVAEAVAPENADRINESLPSIAPRQEWLKLTSNIRATAELVDRRMRESEIQRLHLKLDSLADAKPAESLSASQRASLIVSISDQSALHWGAARKSVAADMSRVIETFPNTSGAMLAEQFIAEQSFQ